MSDEEVLKARNRQLKLLAASKYYLGDSVYASYDGYQIWLTTENNREGDPSNAIALEPAVYWQLVEYQKRLEHLTASED